MSLELTLQFLMLSIGFIAVAALFLNVDKKRTQKRLEVELAEYEQQHEQNNQKHN
ncbi:hypothetical protein [Pseudalkalibacillus hwajinpoensis]|uniref:hypothetical protein n=1 Tax=Guptibacillus hwajinpoensis TaxID=208199 RepID=UPI001CD2E291|nr:hypothetical protein [Pseudalkalibacillus hwajinpoensis]MCA0992217.1 hypothetical protein [Pseudalkalibacillus hwajinpoensis]